MTGKPRATGTAIDFRVCMNCCSQKESTTVSIEENKAVSQKRREARGRDSNKEGKETSSSTFVLLRSTSMSDPPSPISEHATPLPTLTSVLLISALKPLYPIPRKNQPTSSRPTQATLRSFLLQIPPAQHAIPPADNGGQQELTKDVVQRKFARDLGLVALWSAEQLDERVREESKGQKEGGQSASSFFARASFA